jgi:hypothetical protein
MNALHCDELHLAYPWKPSREGWVNRCHADLSLKNRQSAVSCWIPPCTLRLDVQVDEIVGSFPGYFGLLEGGLELEQSNSRGASHTCAGKEGPIGGVCPCECVRVQSSWRSSLQESVKRAEYVADVGDWVSPHRALRVYNFVDDTPLQSLETN